MKVEILRLTDMKPFLCHSKLIQSHLIFRKYYSSSLSPSVTELVTIWEQHAEIFFETLKHSLWRCLESFPLTCTISSFLIYNLLMLQATFSQHSQSLQLHVNFWKVPSKCSTCYIEESVSPRKESKPHYFDQFYALSSSSNNQTIFPPIVLPVKQNLLSISVFVPEMFKITLKIV